MFDWIVDDPLLAFAEIKEDPQVIAVVAKCNWMRGQAIEEIADLVGVDLMRCQVRELRDELLL
ncbi:MAG: hypothetical protein AAFX93_20525, partial [Verrucomicrobiota bacterium]